MLAISVLDITNHKYGKLTVIKRHGRNTSNKITWLCKCDCGNETIVAGNSLRTGYTESCGCLKGRSLEYLTGMTFNRWKVKERIEDANDQNTKWKCVCECGNESIVASGALKSGMSKSCGCYKNEQTSQRNRAMATHGKTNTRLYRIWNNMKDRCLNSNSKDFVNYGGRGIRIHEDWINDFQVFYDWAMNNGYSYELSIDRMDNNGHYEPSNCRWTTMEEQQNNTRNNCNITIDGITKTASEWSKISGIGSKTIIYRYKNNWDESKLLIKPNRRNRYGR